MYQKFYHECLDEGRRFCIETLPSSLSVGLKVVLALKGIANFCHGLDLNVVLRY